MHFLHIAVSKLSAFFILFELFLVGPAGLEPATKKLCVSLSLS